MNKKLIITVLILIPAAGMILFFTKPEKREPLKKESTDISKEASPIKNIPQPSPAGSLERDAKGKQKKVERIEEQYKKHGKAAIISTKNAIEKPKEKLDLPTIEADWNNPLPMNFIALRKVYMYYRVKEKFPKKVVETINGAAVEVEGAIMPLDKIPEDGVFQRFWLANPRVVQAGCVFCNPPTLADLILVEVPAGQQGVSVDRERLFTDVVRIKLSGQFFLGFKTEKDGTQSLFHLIYGNHELLN